jgi:hypothetical protein
MLEIRNQLEAEEDDPVERFSDIQRSIEKLLDYIESTYIGKVIIKDILHPDDNMIIKVHKL